MKKNPKISAISINVTRLSSSVEWQIWNRILKHYLLYAIYEKQLDKITKKAGKERDEKLWAEAIWKSDKEEFKTNSFIKQDKKEYFIRMTGITPKRKWVTSCDVFLNDIVPT